MLAGLDVIYREAKMDDVSSLFFFTFYLTEELRSYFTQFGPVRNCRIAFVSIFKLPVIIFKGSMYTPLCVVKYKSVMCTSFYFSSAF